MLIGANPFHPYSILNSSPPAHTPHTNTFNQIPIIQLKTCPERSRENSILFCVKNYRIKTGGKPAILCSPSRGNPPNPSHPCSILNSTPLATTFSPYPVYPFFYHVIQLVQFLMFLILSHPSRRNRRLTQCQAAIIGRRLSMP